MAIKVPSVGLEVGDKGEPQFVLHFDALGYQRTRSLSLPLTMRYYSALLALPLPTE